jgi:hypothetical protein
VLLNIDRLTARYDLDVTEVNILDDIAIYEQYREIIPVVEVTDAPVGRLVVPITEPALHTYFKMAQQAILVPKESWLDGVARKVGRR